MIIVASKLSSSPPAKPSSGHRRTENSDPPGPPAGFRVWAAPRRSVGPLLVCSTSRAAHSRVSWSIHTAERPEKPINTWSAGHTRRKSSPEVSPSASSASPVSIEMRAAPLSWSKVPHRPRIRRIVASSRPSKPINSWPAGHRRRISPLLPSVPYHSVGELHYAMGSMVYTKTDLYSHRKSVAAAISVAIGYRRRCLQANGCVPRPLGILPTRVGAAFRPAHDFGHRSRQSR